MRRKILWGLLTLILVAAAGFTWLVGGPANVLGILRYDQRTEGTLRVGDAAPGAPLWSLDGRSTLLLASDRGARPLVLIFGSFT